MKHRLFIAIDLPSSAKTEIATLQGKLMKKNLPIHWQEPEKIHITTNFLGAIEEHRMTGIIGNVRAIAKRYDTMTLQPYFLGYFYKKRVPSIIFLETVGDTNSLKILQKELVEILAELQLPRQARFDPYITIGEAVKSDPTETKKVLSEIANIEIVPLSPFEVKSLTLFESLLQKTVHSISE